MTPAAEAVRAPYRGGATATPGRSGVGATARAGQTGGMGLDPTRRHVRRTSDYVFVAAALIVAVALVAWAFLG